MANRERLYEQFGPKLIEALTIIIKDEINVLRTKEGLPEKDNQQIINTLSNKLNELDDYEFAKREFNQIEQGGEEHVIRT